MFDLDGAGVTIIIAVSDVCHYRWFQLSLPQTDQSYLASLIIKYPEHFTQDKRVKIIPVFMRDEKPACH